MATYSEDEMLMLSGIQHYQFCPRQWALIHIEQVWAENRLTAEGQILHKHVDDPFYRQKCGETITLRSVSIASKELGLYGVTDAIELHKVNSSDNAITHPKYPGFWAPIPIEYKHGKPKSNEVDEVQLAAQVMCLEEMYNIHIPIAYFYYAAIRHRQKIEINDKLRSIVLERSAQMHETFSAQLLPKAIRKEHCKRCSLINECMPELSQRTSVEQYLNKNLLL